jgi:hypothetical protein
VADIVRPAKRWIKLYSDTWETEEVIRVTRMLRGANADPINDVDAVVGKITRFWAWADGRTTDGFIPDITPEDIDFRFRTDGFCAALVAVKWLIVEDGGVRIPDFEKNLGVYERKRVDALNRAKAYRDKKKNEKSNANEETNVTDSSRERNANVTGSKRDSRAHDDRDRDDDGDDDADLSGKDQQRGERETSPDQASLSSLPIASLSDLPSAGPIEEWVLNNFPSVGASAIHPLRMWAKEHPEWIQVLFEETAAKHADDPLQPSPVKYMRKLWEKWSENGGPRALHKTQFKPRQQQTTPPPSRPGYAGQYKILK